MREAYASAPPSDDYLETLLRKDHVIPLVAMADGARDRRARRV